MLFASGMDGNIQLRILLVGNGGREHAIAWKLAQSVRVSRIHVVPGNGGTATLGDKVTNVTTTSTADFPALLQYALHHDINLLVPGPEAPLVDGVIDYFVKHGPAKIALFGPSQSAARMEGSKVFAKNFMETHNIPTAIYKTFTSSQEGKAFLKSNRDRKWVIKADGLAAGKGVVIPQTHEEAMEALDSMMEARQFGAAGDQVVIEEFLHGEEISVLSFCDGYTVRSLPAAQDHKRINDNDEGKNTGGMGAYAPASVATPEIMMRIETEVLQPTIDNMRKQGFPMVGCLFTGFVLTSSGPRVLEYNVRFGDPEVQTLLPLLETDLADIMLACSKHTLDAIDLTLSPSFSTCVVVAAGGYPDSYPKGTEMTLKPTDKDTVLFHAGTTLDPSNTLRTAGGRVIAATALGSSVRAAVDKAYTAIESIHFDRMHYRRDIARRELTRRHASATSPQQQGTNESLTYASAGVSIDAGNDLVQRIKAFADVGGFGGVLDLATAGFGEGAPRLVSSIDGIGTKLFVAQALNEYSTIGIDLVAMNVNDLVVQGAQPVQFLDYYACSALDVDDAATFIKGVAAGCKEAGCSLAGGETAEMPGLYQDKDFDAAGCAIGVLKRSERLLPDVHAMKSGDILLGLASTGVHSNGFSLVRKIVGRAGLKYGDVAPWDSASTVGHALLTPTRIYVKTLLSVLRSDAGSAIKGLAHITGGGLVENVPRMLPERLAARILTSRWRMPAVFQWLQSAGGVYSSEMVRTFNCGIGMVCAVEQERVDQVEQAFRDVDEALQVYRIGALEPRGDKRLACIIDGTVG